MMIINIIILERHIDLKELYNERRSDDLSSDVCQKIEEGVIDRHHLRWVFEKVRLIIFDQFDYNIMEQNSVTYTQCFLLFY